MHCKDKHDFSELLSKIYTKLMTCYPYRAGNARTIKEFLREYSIGKSKEIGLEKVELDWSKVDNNVLDSDVALAFENALTPVESNVK